ncbi:MAG: glycerate kinase [Bacteroidales bacterium]|nr:glycerate kinase [Bacteroidales bacterium]
MRKIVIAADSFKGSLSSREVADAVTSGIIKIHPNCRVTPIEVADGGEGTTDVISSYIGGKTETAQVHDPLGRIIRASYHITDKGTAIMEMAAASGLTLLEKEYRNPLLTSTYGTGEMILDAFKKGCRKFIIGIGGSATNDGGTGMLEALGFRFIDRHCRPLNGLCGEKLQDIAVIDGNDVPQELIDSEFIIICDVTTPFCGPEGATTVYAPQKGADAKALKTLEEGMQSLEKVIYDGYGIRLSAAVGSGAAGGLGGAFLAFLKGRLERGIDMVLDTIGFDNMIQGSDLIITGEGKIDNQTGQGKVISGVVSRAKKQNIPVIAIAGISDICQDGIINLGLDAVFPIGPRPQNESDLDYAMRPEVASKRISETVAKALEELSPSLYRVNL